MWKVFHFYAIIRSQFSLSDCTLIFLSAVATFFATLIAGKSESRFYQRLVKREIGFRKRWTWRSFQRWRCHSLLIIHEPAATICKLIETTRSPRNNSSRLDRLDRKHQHYCEWWLLSQALTILPTRLKFIEREDTQERHFRQKFSLWNSIGTFFRVTERWKRNDWIIFKCISLEKKTHL